jgi:1-acyl-sn-glycerol-3-phosphate acyltransferase
VRALLLFVFRRIVAIYFREVEVSGEVPPEATGGRLFAANHTNALVDPILVLTQAPCRISPIAKSTLWNIPGLRWLLDAADAVPIVRRRDHPNKSSEDNEAVFERVASHLGGGGNILIFPEGTSHNEPHLLALRSGAGRMLARARGDGARAGLTFQAVALEFDARDVFRSRALVLFGPVREVDALARELPTGHAPAELAAAVTERARLDLSELLVEGATWEERVLVVHVAEMFANDARDGSLAEMNRIGRQIERARAALRAESAGLGARLGDERPDGDASSDLGGSADLVAQIEARVGEYFRELEDVGVGDRFVERLARASEPRPAELASAAFEPERLGSAALLVLALPLAVAGSALYWLPYQLPRVVTRRLAGDPDVASTYKLGVGLLVFPGWAALAVALAFERMPLDAAWVATLVIVVSPFAALAWLDRWDRVAARARLLAPSEERRERLVALAARRRALMRDLDAARARSGV